MWGIDAGGCNGPNVDCPSPKVNVHDVIVTGAEALLPEPLKITSKGVGPEVGFAVSTAVGGGYVTVMTTLLVCTKQSLVHVPSL